MREKINFFQLKSQSTVGLNSDQITNLINEVGEVDTSEGFYHLAKEATEARQSALDLLNDELLKVVGQEAEAKRQEELAEENRLRQIEIDKQQEGMRLQQEEIDQKQVEFDRVEQEKAEELQAKIDEENLIQYEKEQAELKIKRDAEQLEQLEQHIHKMDELKAKHEAECKAKEERLEKERIETENKLRASRTVNRNTAAKALVDELKIDKELAINIMNLQAEGKVPFVQTNF